MYDVPGYISTQVFGEPKFKMKTKWCEPSDCKRTTRHVAKEKVGGAPSIEKLHNS